MNRQSVAKRFGRQGFTLVELLVVLGLMLILAALAVAFVPSMAQRQNTWRAADRAQGWLVIARQWAKKDQRPTGLRFQLGTVLPNAATPNPAWVTDVQYIQQPDDIFAQPGLAGGLTPGIRRVTTVPGSNSSILLERLPANLRPPMLPTGAPVPPGTIVPGEFSNGYGLIPTPAGFQPNNPTLWPVQVGDYISIPAGDGLVHQITSISSFNYQPADPIPGTSVFEANLLTLNSALINAVNSPTGYYRIIRGPRLLPGEQALRLTQDVAIDLNLSRLPSGSSYVPGITGAVDVLFGPSGPVVDSTSATDKIILFVRDVTKTSLQGDLTLLTINCRTGYVGSQPVDTSVFTFGQNNLIPPAAPYQLTLANGPVAAGTYVVLDADGANPEVQLVQVSNGNVIVLGQVNYPHTAPFKVIVNPYNYALDPRASGL
jgi:prepilin-type N-terminal cleavage/methylation domain-containing protein